MPLYRFQMHDGQHRHLFHETDLPTIDSLRSEAARCMGDLIASGTARLWNDGDWGMDVVTERGTVLFSLFVTVIDAAAMIA